MKRREFIKLSSLLGAGAAGYILKKSVPEDIVNGIQAVSAGETFLSPAITGVVVSQFKDFLSGAAQTDDLFGRRGLHPHGFPLDRRHEPGA